MKGKNGNMNTSDKNTKIRDRYGRFTSEGSKGLLNFKWAGDSVKYSGLHNWIRRNYGKPKQCHNCKSRKNVQWANISQSYSRDRNDWVELCVSCHHRFDGKSKNILNKNRKIINT